MVNLIFFRIIHPTQHCREAALPTEDAEPRILFGVQMAACVSSGAYSSQYFPLFRDSEKITLMMHKQFLRMCSLSEGGISKYSTYFSLLFFPLLLSGRGGERSPSLSLQPGSCAVRNVNIPGAVGLEACLSEPCSSCEVLFILLLMGKLTLLNVLCLYTAPS